MTELFGRNLRRIAAWGVALALGACATTPTEYPIKAQVEAASTPQKAVVLAAQNLATVTRQFPAAVQAMDSAGKCARTLEQLASALEAVVIAEARYTKAVPPTAPRPPEVQAAMNQLDIVNQPQVRSSLQSMAAKCQRYGGDKRVAAAQARIITAVEDIEALEAAYDARKPKPKVKTPPSKKKKHSVPPTKKKKRH